MEIHADQSFGDPSIYSSFIWFRLQPLVRAAIFHWFDFMIDVRLYFTVNQ